MDLKFFRYPNGFPISCDDSPHSSGISSSPSFKAVFFLYRCCYLYSFSKSCQEDPVPPSFFFRSLTEPSSDHAGCNLLPLPSPCWSPLYPPVHFLRIQHCKSRLAPPSSLPCSITPNRTYRLHSGFFFAMTAFVHLPSFLRRPFSRFVFFLSFALPD